MNNSTEHITRRKTRFWKDMGMVLLHPLSSIKLLAGFSLPANFRERVMLAVTEVNGCGFCSWMHTREALRAGITRDDIRALLAAQFEGVPEEQRAAILYAQHWADTQGAVDAEARTAFQTAYDERTADQIVFTIRFMNAMNHMMITLEGLNPFAKKAVRT